MKYFDAFSGYGGFSLGIQKAYENSRMVRNGQADNSLPGGQEAVNGSGVGNQQAKRPSNESNESTPTCIGYSEIDKYAIQIYSKHFPEHKNYGSITDINASELPDFDLLVGGFPCQAFSIAGKRGGFEDTRGTLIYDVLRIVKEKHPRLVLLENVKGLLSHDSGRAFKTIITALAELGYAVEWQVLNTKNFGVPQNRERVFIIGHLGGFGGRQVFPIGGEYHVNFQENGKGNAYCLQAGGDKHRGTYVRTDEQNTLEGGDKPNNPNNIRRTPYTDGMRIRRLTPVECERLMGLPDGWTEGVSDTQRYKLCGNGVVVNVVEEIIKRLTSNHKEYERNNTSRNSC